MTSTLTDIIKLPWHLSGWGVVALLLGYSLPVAAAPGAGTTTAPVGEKVGANYLLIPKGTYMLGANQSVSSIDYIYGIVTGGMDGPQIGAVNSIGGVVNNKWQGANTTATANTTYWVKSRMNYVENGMAKTTVWVRGQCTTPP